MEIKGNWALSYLLKLGQVITYTKLKVVSLYNFYLTSLRALAPFDHGHRLLSIVSFFFQNGGRNIADFLDYGP